MKTIALVSANYTSDKFGSLTNQRPLASLPFGGRYRLLDFVLSNLVNSGITKVGIITPFNTSSVIDHVGSGKPWSLDRKKDGLFLMPGSVYGIHTGDTRFLFRDIIDNKAFFEKSQADYVIIAASSDVYNMDYSDMIKAHEESGSQVTILYKKVALDEGKNGLYLDINSKTNIVRGIYDYAPAGPANAFMDCMIVNKSFLTDCIKWFYQLEYKDFIEIISDNIDKFSVDCYEFKGYLGKINNLKDYMKVSKDISDYDIRNEVFNADRTIITKVQDDAPVLYKGNGTSKNSVIGAGCKIEGRVEDTTIFRSCKIGKDAYIKNSIIMMYCEIGEGAVLENVICDKDVKVSAGAKIIGTPDNPIVLDKGTTV